MKLCDISKDALQIDYGHKIFSRWGRTNNLQTECLMSSLPIIIEYGMGKKKKKHSHFLVSDMCLQHG